MSLWGRLAGTAIAAAAGAVAARAVTRTIAENPPGGAIRWERTNHRGETVTLAAGPAAAAGAVAGAALAPGLPARVRAAGVLGAAAVGAVGLYDDLAGTSSDKGLKGHLSALARGEVTSGTMKIAVIGTTGLVGSALVSRNVIDTLIGGAAIAGHANVMNLLDLRPGRAIKAALLQAPLVIGGPAGPVAAAGLGAAGALLGDDLAEKSMLGDAGANALGAVLGLALVAREGRAARLVHLGAVTGLTLASEKVSFTQVIARTPGLRDLDEFGRRPPEMPSP
jgi:UDP-N-acetylmuramyl pentapeptide phosphotransferase/UDP-N-acetylglucosamine-1-phosphate transferase